MAEFESIHSRSRKDFSMIPAMVNPSDSRMLDEIVTENARLWLRRRVASRRVERKMYSLNNLAEEMVSHLNLEPEFKEYGGNEVPRLDRVGRTVSRFLGLGSSQKATWRLDYLEAFSKAMGITVEELFSPVEKLSPEDRETLDRLSQHARWIIPAAEKKSKRQP
jgi:hypothetical protein